MESTDRIEAEHEADSRADTRAIFVIAITLMVGAVFFVSGWTF